MLVGINRKSGYLPERLLLTGVAVSALFDAVRSVMLAGGDPRGQQVIAWLAGSTYYVDVTNAIVVGGIAAVLALVTLPFTRWLDILPLGAPTAKALGVSLNRAAFGPAVIGGAANRLCHVGGGAAFVYWPAGTAYGAFGGLLQG